MEILGIEPKITKCKFVVLPVKLYPLFLRKKVIKRVKGIMYNITWFLKLSLFEKRLERLRY